MKATLTLTFTDGSTKDILLDKCIVINYAKETQHERKEEISFRETNKGWVMAVSSHTLDGKELAENFLTVSKHE